MAGTQQTRIALVMGRMERISRPVSSAETRISRTTAIPITSNPMATGNGGSFNREKRIIAKKADMPQNVMSALVSKADMCGATSDVC